MLLSKQIEQALPRDVDGIHDIEIASSEQESIRTTLFLPTNTFQNDPPALICILHYAGQPTRFYGKPLLENLFLPVLKEYNVVLVAPESIGEQWHSEKNESFVMKLLYAVKNVYDVDPLRILIGGYSMGALGTFHFLDHYPNFFSGGIAIAGFPAGPISPPLPMHLFVSENDEIFDYKNLIKNYKKGIKAGHNLSLTKVPALSHYDVKTFADHFHVIKSWLNTLWS